MDPKRQKIEDLYEKIERGETSIDNYRELISTLLYEGLIDEVINTSSQALNTLESSYKMPEEFHHPLIKALINQGEPVPIEIFTVDLETNYDINEDEPVKRMVRKGRRFIRRSCYGSTFPNRISEENWWREGPHVVPEQNDKGSELDEWIPMKILEKNGPSLKYLMMGHTPKNALDMEIDESSISFIEPLTTNYPAGEDLEDWPLEMGIYKDEEIKLTFY